MVTTPQKICEGCRPDRLSVAGWAWLQRHNSWGCDSRAWALLWALLALWVAPLRPCLTAKSTRDQPDHSATGAKLQAKERAGSRRASVGGWRGLQVQRHRPGHG